jgi:phosphosulfolactate phosphohydrolase-like enzyme
MTRSTPIQVDLAWGDEIRGSQDRAAGTVAVPVDVLRASTTIATALAWGARQVTVVRDMDDVPAVAATRAWPVITAGEDAGLPDDRCDTLSSPSELARLLQVKAGAEVILRTTNFARVVVDAARCAEHVVAGGVASAAAAARAIAALRPERVLLVPCGTHRLQQFPAALETPLRSAEDAVGAMAVLMRLREHAPTVLTAAVRQLWDLWEPVLGSPSCVAAVVSGTDYAEYMRRLPDAGHDEPAIHRRDIELCARLDDLPVAPVLSRVEGVEHVFEASRNGEL